MHNECFDVLRPVESSVWVGMFLFTYVTLLSLHKNIVYVANSLWFFILLIEKCFYNFIWIIFLPFVDKFRKQVLMYVLTIRLHYFLYLHITFVSYTWYFYDMFECYLSTSKTTVFLPGFSMCYFFLKLFWSRTYSFQ